MNWVRGCGSCLVNVAFHVVLPLQVAANQSGSLVYKIDPLAPAHDVLQENDVVMEIDKVPIADDGTVEFRNEERVEFSHIVRAKHIGLNRIQGNLPQMCVSRSSQLSSNCDNAEH